jgi:putative endonuclease
VEVVRVRAKDALGRYGEDVAVRHLVEGGMAILDRNWRCELGEIDIVARDGDTLVVCEVKTRRGVGYGRPAEAVTRAKAVRLRRLAVRWMQDRSVHPPLVRIDVVGVLRFPRGPAEVEHLRGVA